MRAEERMNAKFESTEVHTDGRRQRIPMKKMRERERDTSKMFEILIVV
jgi:hypothetical protein